MQHGGVARAEDLRAHGRLYFVPVGKQVIPAETLADYYRTKFAADITVLPPLETQPEDCIAARNQCAAEDLQARMTSIYGEIARDPDSVMIALTDEDIFPRSRGWQFTYSWHSSRIGIVSTHRMDPAFWREPASETGRLASTRQMLTKYIAMLYYHVPTSYDPTSVMYTPLTPNGGSDDIYESDLHSEESANGLRGSYAPCLYFAYSYETHQVSLDQPHLSDCDYVNSAHAGEETFTTNLGWGYLTQRSLDVALDSTPAIVFRRGYNSGYRGSANFGLGWSVNHSYNAWLASDGLASLTHIDVTREDGTKEEFKRRDQGRGFDPNAVYQTEDDAIYGARITWQSNLYKLQYGDGAIATFLDCETRNVQCYFNGYQDAQGNVLRFDRAANRELEQVTSSDRQSLAFKYDDRHRLASMEASNGKHALYEYDAAGCLARVQRADGQVAIYKYDPLHRMTSFSVARGPDAPEENVLTNDYDNQGRVVRQTMAGIGTFKIDYLAQGADRFAEALRITEPSGRILKLEVGNEFVAHADTVRFRAASR